MTEKYEGIKASTGYAIGKVYLFTREKIEVNQDKISADLAESEYQKVKDAIDSYFEDLSNLDNPTEAQQNIANAHKELLQDPYFSDTIEGKIKNENKNSELALDETIREMVEIMSALDDEYLKERASDYQDIGFQVMYLSLIHI